MANNQLRMTWTQLDLPQEMNKSDGSLTSSIVERLQSWTDHFHRLFNPSSVNLLIRTTCLIIAGTIPILIMPFTTEEIHSALVRISSRFTAIQTFWSLYSNLHGCIVTKMWQTPCFNLWSSVLVELCRSTSMMSQFLLEHFSPPQEVASLSQQERTTVVQHAYE